MSSIQKQNFFFGGAAFLSALLALLGFLSASGNDSAAQRALLIVCSILLAALAGLYTYVILLSRDREPNYFLYDRLSGHNIPLSELTWRMVNDKVGRFISENIGSDVLLFTTGLLSAENRFGPGGAMRPLAAFKMLCDIALDETGDFFRLFEQADESVILSLCRIIDGAGEHDMAAAILTYKTKGGSPDNFRRYLSSNSRYIQSRMLVYTRRNIELFY
jgi:hypothetical protein